MRAETGGPHGETPTAMFGSVSIATTVRRGATTTPGFTANAATALGNENAVSARPAGSAAASRTASATLRSPASSSLAASSRPEATADSSAASICASCSSVFLVPMQSRSQPAATARTAASGMPMSPLAPTMSSASVTTTPRKPRSPRSRSCTTAREKVAGLSASICGSRMCELMTVLAPAATDASNGSSSRARSASSGRSTTGSARCESWAVSPWPGKCFALTATPVASCAATQAALCSATSSGSLPKLRTPITGLSAFELMSTSGAKLRLTPTARNSSPTAVATLAV
jgi:hypothetical protein